MTHEQRNQRREAIIREIRSGDSIRDIATRHGVKEGTVASLARVSGMSVMRKTGRKNVTLRIVAALIRGEINQNQIAAEFGVSRQLVGQITDAAEAAGIRLSVVRRTHAA